MRQCKEEFETLIQRLNMKSRFVLYSTEHSKPCDWVYYIDTVRKSHVGLYEDNCVGLYEFATLKLYKSFSSLKHLKEWLLLKFVTKTIDGCELKEPITKDTANIGKHTKSDITKSDIEAIVNMLNVGDTFVMYSDIVAYNNIKYRIMNYGFNKVSIQKLSTLDILRTFESLKDCKQQIINLYIDNKITGIAIVNDNNITSNQMSLSEFKKELHKLKDNAYLHLWNFKNELTSYKVMMNWDYNAPYSVTLKNLTKNDTNYDMTARNIAQVIDAFTDLFKNDTYCKCVVAISRESSDTTNKPTGIHPIIAIRDEDKIDLIQDNSYIRLIEPDETEYEYIVSINPKASYTGQIVSLHGVHKTDNNPSYSSLDELKCALKTDIKNGKYSSIEVIQLSPIYDISNYTYIKPDEDWVKSCMSDEDEAKLSEPLKELNKASESNVFYPYKRHEIIQHKECGIGFTNDNTFTNPCSAYKSAPCMFWDNDMYKFLKKYCTQLNITPYYPTLGEIKENKLTCYIILKNGNTFKYLLKYLSAPYMNNNDKKAIISGKYKEQKEKNYNIAVVQIKKGEIVDIIYVNNKWFANIKCYDINMSNNTLIDTNIHKYVQEESKMKRINVLQSTEQRINKTNNTKYDVITTEVTVGNIHNIVTLSVNDENDTKMAVMYAICNAVVGGNFDIAYEKYLKEKEAKENPISARTCSYCGMIFNTIQEKEEHEKLEHIEKRKARHERYLIRKEAKRRLAEIEQEKLDAEREKAIRAKMKEMQKTDKKSK